jgi:hypothetical protein
MRSAQNRRKKSNFMRKIRSFFVYTFIAIFVLGFFLNTFISNILEYSFALANSGGVVDIKTDEKYSIVLISSNKLKEIKDFNLISFDKKNQKLVNLNLNKSILISEGGREYPLGDLLLQNKNLNPEEINHLLEEVLGTKIAFTYITSSDEYKLVKDLALGNGNLYDLYLAKEVPGISLRDLYFIFSFAGSIDSKDKKDLSVNSISDVDKELKDIYMDSILGENSPSITIINSSGINGMGKKLTRIIGNHGGRVIDTSTGDEIISESFFIYKVENDYLSYLSTKLGISKSLSMEEVGLKYPEIIKSDLVIVLGVDRKE